MPPKDDDTPDLERCQAAAWRFAVMAEERWQKLNVEITRTASQARRDERRRKRDAALATMIYWRSLCGGTLGSL